METPISIGGSLSSAFAESLTDTSGRREKIAIAKTFWYIVKNTEDSSDSTKLLAVRMLETLDLCLGTFEEEEVVAVSTYPVQRDEQRSDYYGGDYIPDILGDIRKNSVPPSSGKEAEKEKDDEEEEDYGQIPCEDLCSIPLSGCVIGTIEGKGGRKIRLTRYNDGLPPGIEPPNLDPVSESDNIGS